MVKIKYMDEILREACGERGVAVSHVRKEVDQVSKGDDARIRRRCWGLEEKFTLGLILGVSAVEVFFIGASCSSAHVRVDRSGWNTLGLAGFYTVGLIYDSIVSFFPTKPFIILTNRHRLSQERLAYASSYFRGALRCPL